MQKEAGQARVGDEGSQPGVCSLQLLVWGSFKEASPGTKLMGQMVRVPVKL